MMRRPLTYAALMLAVWLLACAVAPAQTIVTIGDYTVHPNEPAHVVLSVSDATASAIAVDGFDMTFELAGGIGHTPKITSVDLLNSTVFSGLVSSADPPAGGNEDQYQARYLLLDAEGGTISANGTLARLTIDTTGALPGVYPLRLSPLFVGNNVSQFYTLSGDPVAADFLVGSLNIVPEPSSFLLGAIALGALALRHIRRVHRPIR